MSVIIRLQNLPWNANALDIRRFFQGLSIPDGGVHIIGGEKGDAFIAFSTDEDARQAMMKDANRINGYAIKLLLSSKTEMQNVIAAAKGGPPPPLPAASSITVPKPGGFFERTIIPVGGQLPFLGGGDVTGSGQGLRSSTGLGGNLPPAVPYGYPGSSGQVMQPAQPAGYMVRMNEPVGMPAASVMPPPAGRSIFDTRPVGNLQQPPPAAPMDPMGSGLRPSLPGPPPVGAWGTSQPPASRDVPPPNFARPAELPGPQGAGFGSFNPPAGREPVRMDVGGQPDVGFRRNGHAYGSPENGRNFIPGPDAGRNLGPPPDVGRDFGRGDGGPLGRHEELRDPGRFGGNVRSWDRSDRDRNAAELGQGWSGGGRPFGEREGDNSRREFPRPDADRRMSAPDRWMENKNMGPDRGGPREAMPNEGQRPRPGAGDFNDRFDRGRPTVFPEVPGSRYGPDSGPGGTGMPDSRQRGDSRGGFAHPDPGFREPARPLMEKDLRRPPEERWMEERRGFGPPTNPGFEARRPSPPRDHPFQSGFFPRDEPWRNEHRDFDPRQMREPAPDHNLSVRGTNFPRTYNYRDVRRILKDCDIPHDGVKLLNDRMGMRTGVVFVHFADAQSLNRALDKTGMMVERGSRICIERCTDADFDAAVDGVPMKHVDRSRSPRNRQVQVDENPNLSYFVLKKLPAKTEKEDIRKFLGKFRIAADGGPFFELAFDKSQTGNALVTLEEKEVAKVLALHHTTLNGARVDVVKINSYEFAERSRRARQLERDGDKNAGQSKPSSVRDAKAEKQDPKPKEADRDGASVAEDEGYCVELRGIPYTASAPMVQDYFHDISVAVDRIHISYNREHRATGIAFVEFSSSAEQKRALEKNKQHMGHRMVDIRALNRMTMVEEYNKQQRKFGGPPMPVPTVRPSTDHSKQGSKFLLSMQNLHYDTQLEDILDFFSGYQPIVESIQLQYKDNQPTGDGLVAFESMQEAESALRNKNRHVLRGKPVTLAWPKN